MFTTSSCEPVNKLYRLLIDLNDLAITSVPLIVTMYCRQATLVRVLSQGPLCRILLCVGAWQMINLGFKITYYAKQYTSLYGEALVSTELLNIVPNPGGLIFLVA